MALKYSISFVLMQTKVRNKPTTLRCFVRFNNVRSVFTTDVKVEPRYFNQSKQRADVVSRYDGSEANMRLDEIAAFVGSRFAGMIDFPNPVDFQELCRRFVKSGESFTTTDTVGDTPRTLISYIEKMASDSRSGKRRVPKGPRKGQKYKDDSIKPYDSAVYVLRRFANHESVEDFPFRSIDESFYDRFSEFFYNVCGYSVGYFATNIKVIKLAMNESALDGLHNSNAHNSRGFLRPEYESDTISLDLSQLKTIYDYQFQEGQERLENARDLFLVGCWTGLRFEDYSSIRRQDIHEDFIRIQTDKTSERVSIPLHPVLRSIFAKYGGGPPPAMHINYVNKHIKTVCRKAKLNTKMTIRKSKGGVDVMEEYELWQLVSTHTARRSFASNMFRLGIPSMLIMAITGHKTEGAFLRYIRVGEEEKSRLMAERWKAIQWD